MTTCLFINLDSKKVEPKAGHWESISAGQKMLTLTTESDEGRGGEGEKKRREEKEGKEEKRGGGERKGRRLYDQVLKPEVWGIRLKKGSHFCNSISIACLQMRSTGGRKVT